MFILTCYMLIGIVWIGICILIGAFKIQTNNPPLTLLFMASIWPYLFYRIVKGLLQGEEETDLWP